MIRIFYWCIVITADLAYLTITEAAELIAGREISPVELTEALVRRIRSLDPQINAFITVTEEFARGQARAAEKEIAAGRHRGPMHGIPFGLKDIYNTAGILTSAHSKICIYNIPNEDASTVSKLYQAGAVLLGKLATHEFAHGGPATDLPWPPARNPWNPEHYTGGSSSGPGAAVASGFIPCALGTDTGGSIRGPASLCGVVGLRPTYGLVSRFGVMPSSFTFDTCGPMTRTVEDCAIMLQAIAGHDPKDPASANRPVPDYRAGLKPDLRGLRIGVIRHFWEEDLPAHEAVREAMDTALNVLSGLGAKLQIVRMRQLQDYYDVMKTIALPELMGIHSKDLIERPGDFSAAFRSRGALAACLFQAADYVQAQRERSRMLMEMKPLYESHDVFVTAGDPGPASRLDAYKAISYWQRPNMTSAFSVTGGPALVVCNGFSHGGLPLGMQVAGRPFDDATVLRVGYAYERATAWSSRRPAFIEGAQPTPISIDSRSTGAPAIDERTLEFVRMQTERAGWGLTESQFSELSYSAPYALAMARRVRRHFDRSDEPANVFCFPD